MQLVRAPRLMEIQQGHSSSTGVWLHKLRSYQTLSVSKLDSHSLGRIHSIVQLL